MTETAIFKMPEATREMRNKAAIIGMGETDYHSDYLAARAKAPGYEPLTPEGLAKTAFERALADSGLSRKDIDGISVSYLYGGPSAAETAQMLGIDARYTVEVPGIMAGPLPAACAAIASGKCDTIAMIYAVASRSIGRKYGGAVFKDDVGVPTSYYYHHPWGWSSQAAHWAFIWNYYRSTYGATEEDLGSVAIQLRKNAMANPECRDAETDHNRGLPAIPLHRASAAFAGFLPGQRWRRLSDRAPCRQDQRSAAYAGAGVGLGRNQSPQ